MPSSRVMLILLLVGLSVGMSSCNKETNGSYFEDEIDYPGNVEISFSAETESATLRWDRVVEAAGYSIWASSSETSAYTFLADVTTTEYTDNLIERNTQKFYKIKSYNSYASSIFSVPVSVINTVTDEEDPTQGVRYDFVTFKDWSYMHQDTATIEQYRIDDGNLFLSTRAGTYDRTKANLMATKMGAGKSSCRLYVPTMYPNDQTSIASFLYSDDHHEIDFEIGYGKADTRLKYDAGDDEVLCYMTSQGFPFHSEIVTLKMNRWYVIDIDLSLKNGSYFVQWFVDGEVKSTLQQSFGSEVQFRPILSLENLKFLGDHISGHDYEVEFDWLEITHYED